MAINTIFFSQNFNQASNELASYFSENFQQVSSQYLSHGCWCAKLDKNTQMHSTSNIQLGGVPVDALDKICRDWSKARHCNDQISGGACFEYPDDASYYVMAKDDTNGDKSAFSERFQCYDETNSPSGYTTDDCNVSSCKIDLHYFDKIVTAFNGNQDYPNMVEATDNTCQPLKEVQNNYRNSRCEGIDIFGEQVDDVVKCGEGQHLDPELLVCIDNQCNCEFGVASSGIQCPVHDTAGCESCSDGKHLDGSECVDNQCNCRWGVPSSGTHCPMHDKGGCESCPDDRYLLERPVGVCTHGVDCWYKCPLKDPSTFIRSIDYEYDY